MRFNSENGNTIKKNCSLVHDSNIKSFLLYNIPYFSYCFLIMLLTLYIPSRTFQIFFSCLSFLFTLVVRRQQFIRVHFLYSATYSLLYFHGKQKKRKLFPSDLLLYTHNSGFGLRKYSLFLLNWVLRDFSRFYLDINFICILSAK